MNHLKFIGLFIFINRTAILRYILTKECFINNMLLIDPYNTYTGKQKQAVLNR